MSKENQRKKLIHRSDTPPINPEKLDYTDPFNPFKLSVETDGGVVSVDPVQQTFTEQLQPVISKKIDEDKYTRAHSGTLIQEILSYVNSQERKYTYQLENQDGSVKHQIIDTSTREKTIILRNIDSEHFLYLPQEPSPKGGDSKPRRYSNWKTAFAALVETIDWGTPPVTPEIWNYRVPTVHSFSSFNDHLCHSTPTHYLANRSADYGITISVKDVSDLAKRQDTITVFAITSRAHHNAGKTIYRTAVANQHQAFTLLVNLLSGDLSRKITTHDGQHGNQLLVPSTEELIEMKSF